MSFTIFGAMFQRYLTKAAYVPRYRSHGYTTALDIKIRELGEEIQYNTAVEKILVENGKVIGVETSKGDKIKTGIVVSNANQHLVYKCSFFICGPQAMYEFVRKELNGLGLRKKFMRWEHFSGNSSFVR